MKLKLIMPINETIDIYKVHRMLGLNYNTIKGDDIVNLKTYHYNGGHLKDVFEQKQPTHMRASPSFDFLRFYLVNRYEEYDIDTWERLKGGDYKVVEFEVGVET